MQGDCANVMYQLIVERRAAKEIRLLPNEVLSKVIKAIDSLKQNPRPHGVKKLFTEDGWRVRSGDYRVLYTIDDKQKIVTVYRIKHRKDVYR